MMMMMMMMMMMIYVTRLRIVLNECCLNKKKENYLAPTAPPGVSWTLTGSYKNDQSC